MTIQKRLDTSSFENTEEKFGLILMLDALGVRNLRHHEQWQWLHDRDLMLRHLAEQQSWHMRNMENEHSKATEQINSLGLPPESLRELDEMMVLYKEIQEHSDFSSFGDTIVFHSWCSEKYESPEYSFSLMSAILLSLHEIMKVNIKFNLKLRGALSLGRYFLSSDGNSILGSALMDAHRSHEIADWIGILVTPGLCENYMNEIEDVAKSACEKHNITNPGQLVQCNGLSYRERIAVTLCGIMVKHEVPLSHGGTKLCWVPSWPLTLCFDRITSNALNSLGLGHKNIATQCMVQMVHEQDGVEQKYRSKYENTFAFFNMIWDRAQEYFARNMQC